MKMRVLTLGLMLFAWSLTGCFAEGANLNLEVCGDVEIPLEVDGYKVLIYDSERANIEVDGAEDLATCVNGEEKVTSLPTSFNFTEVPPDGWVVLQGLKGGAVVSTFERRLNAEEGDDISISMGITRSCLRISCPIGQTCYGDGQCTTIELGDDRGACNSEPGTEPDPAMPATEPFCEMIPEVGGEQ